VLRDDTTRRRELLALRDRVASLEATIEGSDAEADRPPP
jgi:hypothetical protein